MNRSEAGKLGRIAAAATQKAQYLKRIKKYLQSPNLCKSCNRIIPYEKRVNKFCNHSCSAKFCNEKRKINRLCRCCEKTLDLSTGWKKIYCNRKCQWAYYKKERLKKVIQTGIFESNISAATIKSIVIEIRRLQCEICNRTEWMGKPIPLVMDHIDGNSDDNRLTNLRLVCGNCDMQLPTYKSKNRGNGRHSRRQRYKDGKSY